ncbi:MAG: glycosyltransferase [Cyanobacteria bacterium CRU_2_1]|nr:glycosyltransferase [Cyanobacteria bacterium RU_5_0]NJR60189.1 glycosyltransferase [Cyanobacteria bacterium CRU_2_1]
MSRSPMISVLMPVYNAERYLAQAIESILSQTFSDFEFLIVNDGSTDRSLDWLQHFADRDPRIRLISRPNTGYVQALNEMLQLAQGEYIARMDADDIALPDRFRQQIEFLHHHPSVVCVGGAHEIVDHQGRLLTRLQLPLANAEIQREALAGHGSICHPCAMMRRSAVLAIGGYDERLMPAEDLDLWLRLGEMGELANLPETVLKYRLHLNSVSEKKGHLQRQKAQEACERAWQRRGVNGRFEAANLWRPGSDRASQHQFMLQYGWWAFNSHQRYTAIIYASKAIWAVPLRPDGWKLLACAVLKPLPPQPPPNLADTGTINSV